MLGPMGPLQAATDRAIGGLEVPAGPVLARRWTAAGLLLLCLLTAALALESRGASSLPRAPGHAVVSSSSQLAGRGLAVVNAGQRMLVRFARSGVSVSSGALRMRIGLDRIGYGGALMAVPPAAPALTPGGVSYSRGPLSEWYRNGPAGLEQGFSLSRAPLSAAGPLTLAMKLSGNAHASLRSAGEGVTFTGPAGSTLRYGALRAVDARGGTLHSWLELHGRTLLVRVDARGARYPVAIDPLVQQGAKLAVNSRPGQLAEASFGTSVALSADGNTLVVGAPIGESLAGAVWVYTRSGSSWTEQALIQEPGGGGRTENLCQARGAEEADSCGFGASVALSADGNTLLISTPRVSVECPGEPSRTCYYEGDAWVYERSVNGTEVRWTRHKPPLTGQQIEANTLESENTKFGSRVALSSDGRTAIVGVPASSEQRGGVWAYGRSGSSWTPEGSRLSGGEEVPGGLFGLGLALSGDGTRALVGEPGNGGGRGAVWAFTRSGSTWAPGAKLVGGEASGVAQFGHSVAVSADGNTALIGGPNDSQGREKGQGRGAAWAYTWTGEAWVQQGGQLRPSDETGKGRFGVAVALSPNGNTALIGGPKEERRGGAAWSFVRTSGVWTQDGRLLTGGKEEVGNGLLGSSVSLATPAGGSEIAVVGGPLDANKLGAVWTFVPGIQQEEPEEEKHKEKEKGKHKEEGSGSGVPGGETGSSAGATQTPAGATAGVLPFGPSATSCTVSLVSRNITVLSRGRVAVKLRTSGQGTCKGSLKLTIKVNVAHHRPKTKTLASGSFTLAAGRNGIATLKLNALGRALLRAGHGRLRARLAVRRLSPTPVLARTASVRLTLQRTSRPHH